MTQVVVTGIGAVTPLGVGARTLHERWLAGQSGIEDGEGKASEYEPKEHLSIKEARRADRFTQFAMVAGDEALAEAGWSDELPYDPTRIACIIGTGIGGIGTLEHNHDVLRDSGPKKVSPLSVPLMMSNAAPGALSMRYGLRGHSYGIVSACAAGAHAIGNSANLIQSGMADAVVTGGSEAALTPLSKAAFAALDALSELGISRPFDARRDGFVMGEGARGARARGPREGRGARGERSSRPSRATARPRTPTTSPPRRPRASGAAQAIAQALETAGIKPEDVDYVNAHGTSTPLNDRAETKAIKLALGDHAGEIPVSSTKSAIGHLLGAAGAVEAVATILALRDKMAPPTLGWEEQEEGMDLDYVPNEAQPLKVNGRQPIALSNAFGFGGHNAVLCLEAA